MNNIMKDENAIELLKIDFGQCFQQLRYYGDKQLSLAKTIIGVYTSLGATLVGLYEFKDKLGINYDRIAHYAFVLALIIGIITLGLAVRFRVYFVRVARYINEIRGEYQKNKSLCIENKSHMYNKYDRPEFFTWLSAQSLFFYAICAVNSILVFLIVGKYITFTTVPKYLIIPLVMFILQLRTVTFYLKKKE